MSVLNSRKIREQTAHQPLHLLSSEFLVGQWISSKSRWEDKTWYFDNPTLGAKKSVSTIFWNVKMPDGKTLMDQEYSYMLDWLKRFAWSLYVAPGGGVDALQPGTFGRVSVGIRYFAKWMVGTHRQCPSDLSADAIYIFIEDLKETYRGDAGGSPTRTPFMIRVETLSYLWRQRKVLLKANIPSMPTIPFSGKGNGTVVSGLTKTPNGWLAPLPDEVAVPVLNMAMKFIDQRAEDILKLQEVLRKAYFGSPSLAEATRKTHKRKAALEFEFSTLPDEDLPWHPGITNVNEAQKLITSLKSAAALVIQATSGMRISESCGLKSGMDETTGLPLSVEIRESDSGFYEIFEIKSQLSKTEENPRNVTWTLGIRRKGANNVPPAVHAIIILNRLFQPFREMTANDVLLLNTYGALQTDDSFEFNPITCELIHKGYQNFIEDWVDLSKLPDNSRQRAMENELVEYRETKGRCITTHQLRKLFANFTLRVDGSLLPVLQMQFQHVSIAMTDGGYKGHNIALMKNENTVRTQQAALMLLDEARSAFEDDDAPSGREMIGGQHGKRLKRLIHEKLVPEIRGKPADEQFAGSMDFIELNDIRFIFEHHGICGALGASRMACHDAAGTVEQARWLGSVPKPNYQTREPTMCAGCESFMVAKRHLPFWENRYVELTVQLRQFEILKERQLINEGFPDANEVTKAQAKQAMALCNQLGAEIEELNEIVEKKIKELFDEG